MITILVLTMIWTISAVCSLRYFMSTRDAYLDDMELVAMVTAGPIFWLLWLFYQILRLWWKLVKVTARSL